ncbi:MAG: NAD(P)H-dependent oxidoreductase subunit E [Methylacidiphilales bacterium]|nr:NAD(P)H-dependent oxidoreductase subunit E [Candidatus Methylacidiphilales bacterium]
MSTANVNRVVDPATQTVLPEKVYPGVDDGHHAPPALPKGFEAQADELITHYPVSKRSASMPLLHLWQETFGYISPAGIDWIAAKLGLQPINILELVTFYPMFRQHPAGKIQIKVCRTLSCALGGGYALCDYFREKCKTGEPDAHGLALSPDGKYSVEFVECLAACGTAPVIMINDDFYENVTKSRADELLLKYT